MLHPKNDGLRLKKTIASCSSSHSSNDIFLRIEMSSVRKLGSRAARNTAFYREKLEKKIVANMISKYCDVS